MKYVISPNRKKQAISLREQGKSYNEISQELGVAKSTLSGWLKGIEFSEKVKQEQLTRVKEIWGKNIRDFNQKRHELYVEERNKEINHYAASVQNVSQSSLFFLAIGLFWGEGTKNRPWSIELANADPAIIQVFCRFIRDYCHTPDSKLCGWIHTHENVSCEQAILYWSKVSGISQSKISARAYVSSASKGIKPKRLLPYGTFHLRVQDVQTAKKIYGWLKGVRERTILPE